MTDLNKLFVCSQCGKSIASQMDRLDLVKAKMKFIIDEIDKLKEELEKLT